MAIFGTGFAQGAVAGIKDLEARKIQELNQRILEDSLRAKEDDRHVNRATASVMKRALDNYTNSQEPQSTPIPPLPIPLALSTRLSGVGDDAPIAPYPGEPSVRLKPPAPPQGAQRVPMPPSGVPQQGAQGVPMPPSGVPQQGAQGVPMPPNLGIKNIGGLADKLSTRAVNPPRLEYAEVIKSFEESGLPEHLWPSALARVQNVMAPESKDTIVAVTALAKALGVSEANVAKTMAEYEGKFKIANMQNEGRKYVANMQNEGRKYVADKEAESNSSVAKLRNGANYNELTPDEKRNVRDAYIANPKAFPRTTALQIVADNPGIGRRASEYSTITPSIIAQNKSRAAFVGLINNLNSHIELLEEAMKLPGGLSKSNPLVNRINNTFKINVLGNKEAINQNVLVNALAKEVGKLAVQNLNNSGITVQGTKEYNKILSPDLGPDKILYVLKNTVLPAFKADVTNRDNVINDLHEKQKAIIKSSIGNEASTATSQTRTVTTKDGIVVNNVPNTVTDEEVQAQLDAHKAQSKK